MVIEMNEGKEIPIVIPKKRKSKKKRKNKKQKKNMMWFDRESKMPTIIIDECIWSHSLQKRVYRLGFNVLYLGDGLQDGSIRHYMMRKPNTVLITADKEFDAHFNWKQCFLCENEMPEHELVGLINEFMWQYRESAKHDS